nr:MAG: capsid protein [Cressdnaviricota sp.]
MASSRGSSTVRLNIKRKGKYAKTHSSTSSHRGRAMSIASSYATGGTSGVAANIAGRHIKKYLKSVGPHVRKGISSSNSIGSKEKELDRSKFTVQLSKPKKQFSKSSTWSYVMQNNVLIRNQEGFQGYGDIMHMGHLSGNLLCAVSAPATNYNIATWGNNPFDMNPYANVTGGPVIGAITSTNVNEDQVYWKSAKVDLQLTNFSIVPVWMDVYFVTPKIASAFGPSASWANCLVNRQLGQAAANPPNLSTGAGETQGYTNPTFYGQEPFRESNFRRLWKILRKESITLQAASTHRFDGNFKMNKLLDKSVLQQVNGSGNNWMPRTTVSAFIVYKCAPVLVREGTNIASSDVGVTPGTGLVSAMWTQRHDFRTVGEARLAYDRVTPTFLSETFGGTHTLNTNVFEILTSIVDTVIPNVPE